MSLAVNFSILQLLVAVLFFDLARRRPQVEIEAKLYAFCALAFATSKLPMLFGVPHDVAYKWYVTVCEVTTITWISIALLPYVSRETLAFNAAGFSLGMVGIIAALDTYVLQVTYLLDFIAVSVLGLATVAADRNKNPISGRCLIVASAVYAVLQLGLPGKGTEWFKVLLGSSSLLFSLALLVVLYGRENASTYPAMVRKAKRG